MIETPYAQIGTAITLAVVAFAFRKGDEPERVGAGASALALLASLLLQIESPLAGPQWGLIIVNTVMLAVYAALAWKSRRSWPFWATALQSLIIMSHLLTVIDARPPLAAFHAVMNLANYGILLAIAAGTYQAWRDRRTAVLE